MNAVEKNLANWKESLLSSIPVGDLLSRNPVAYKWKAPFRVWMLREAVFLRHQIVQPPKHGLTQHPHSKGGLTPLRISFRHPFESGCCVRPCFGGCTI